MTNLNPISIVANLNPISEASSTVDTIAQPATTASIAAADHHATETEAVVSTNEQLTTTDPSTTLADFADLVKKRFGATVTFVQDKYAAHGDKIDTVDTCLIFIQSNLILGLSTAATLHFGAKAVNMVEMLDTSPMERFKAGGGHEPIAVSVKAMAITAAIMVVSNVGGTIHAYTHGEATFKDHVLESLKFIVRAQMGLLLVLGMYAVFESILGVAV